MQIVKYNANGNDFIIFHSNKKLDRTKLATRLCHRNKGIGADGMIVIVPNKQYDFEWQFYNSDGSVADMCGNGSRACAHYAYNHELAPKKMKFLTGAGEINAEVDGDFVEVKLTKPSKILDSFVEDGYTWHFYDTGVPHLVAIVDSLDKFNLEISRNMRSKYNSNVNFLVIENEALHVRTYERGVENETYACGTGMAACFYTAYMLKKIGDFARVFPKSNEEVFFRKSDEDIFFKGVVEKVFIAILDEVFD